MDNITRKNIRHIFLSPAPTFALLPAARQRCANDRALESNRSLRSGCAPGHSGGWRRGTNASPGTSAAPNVRDTPA